MTIRQNPIVSDQSADQPADQPADVPRHVDLLILGAGWTSTFLIPALEAAKCTHAQTSTTGRAGTIKFRFSPDDGTIGQYQRLPSAKTVLVTFPLQGHGQSRLLSQLYRSVHGAHNNWIQLGSTGIFAAPHWNDSDSEYDHDARAVAEDELMATVHGCVLNLSGLYGGQRDPKNWVVRVATSKAQVKGKKAVHLIHGEDVARAIVAVHRNFTPGKRWLIADLHVYDWWDLIQSWGPEVRKRAVESMGEAEAAKLDYETWVGELMVEGNIRALPRSAEDLGRVLDSRGFWSHMGVWPAKGRVR